MLFFYYKPRTTKEPKMIAVHITYNEDLENTISARVADEAAAWDKVLEMAAPDVYVDIDEDARTFSYTLGEHGIASGYIG